MANTGNTLPNTAANVATGNYAWANPSNALTANASYAISATSSTPGTSQILVLSNYGFAIPANATVTGVVATIRKLRSATAIISDNTIQLLVGGSLAGSNYAAGAQWSTSPADSVYGGSSDPWGNALTPAIVNASGFGIGIIANHTGGTGSRQAGVDVAWLDVYYTLPPPPSTAIKMHSYRQRRI